MISILLVFKNEATSELQMGPEMELAPKPATHYTCLWAESSEPILAYFPANMYLLNTSIS